MTDGFEMIRQVGNRVVDGTAQQLLAVVLL
jgi:hypothetical protein